MKKLPHLMLGIFLLGCSTSSQKQAEEPVTEESFQINFKDVSALLIDRMDLQPGEKVLLVGTPGRFDSIIPLLAEGITEKNAEYLGSLSVTGVQPEEWSTEFTQGVVDLDREDLKEYLKSVDLGVMLPGPTPADLVYKLIQENLDEEMGRTIHFHWEGAFDINGSPLDITPAVDQFYQEALLETDYAALAQAQQDFETAIRNSPIRVTTLAGTDITFEVGDRPVTKQDGNASAERASIGRNLIDREVELPAGAIRVAPIETTVNGKIAFPDAEWASNPVEGLVLTFENGKVVDMTATSGLGNVEFVMNEVGDVGRSFREFALGFNPEIAIPENDPWIPYYGYGAGIVRLSLGDNTELGGTVSGGYVRWNFFTDATVTVGEEQWVVHGKLVK